MSVLIQIFSLLFVCVCFATSASAKSWKLTNRIIGGAAVVEDLFPYQVAMRSVKTDKIFCGGTIISERYVLTAAHCFLLSPDHRNPSQFYGEVNIYHSTDVGTRLDFSHLAQHSQFAALALGQAEQWDLMAVPDIALLRTFEPIEFSEYVNKVNLPTHDFVPGTKAMLSGWGIIKPLDKTKPPSPDAYKFPTMLQHKIETTISLDECVEGHRRLESTEIDKWKTVNTTINKFKICTRDTDKTGAGNGDSGGPLVADNTVIGIVSWSLGCNEGFPNIYTNVYQQLKWINDQMQSLEARVEFEDEIKEMGLGSLLQE